MIFLSITQCDTPRNLAMIFATCHARICAHMNYNSAKCSTDSRESSAVAVPKQVARVIAYVQCNIIPATRLAFQTFQDINGVVVCTRGITVFTRNSASHQSNNTCGTPHWQHRTHLKPLSSRAVLIRTLWKQKGFHPGVATWFNFWFRSRKPLTI